MQLPLFKGVSDTLMRDIIEKVPLEFQQYREGEQVAKAGDQCTHIYQIISGKASVSRDIFEGRLNMVQVLGSASVLMPDRLMGIDNRFDAAISAASPLSILCLSKARYLDLLEKDRIFLVNYLNYLNYKAQMRSAVISNFRCAPVSVLLSELWHGLGERRAISTSFTTTLQGLEWITGLQADELRSQLIEMADSQEAEISLTNNQLKVTLTVRPD